MKLSPSTVVVLAGLAFVGGLGVYFSIPETSPSIVAPQAQKAPFQEAVALWQPQSSGSGNYQASDVLATLQKDERAIITLPSGNQYSLRLDQRSSDKGVEQLRATVDPDGLPGFGLFTLGEERMFGTLNTPEGVYELVGTPTSFTLRRAVDVDAERRQGKDYKIKPVSQEEALIQDVKQVPVDLGPK